MNAVVTCFRMNAEGLLGVSIDDEVAEGTEVRIFGMDRGHHLTSQRLLGDLTVVRRLLKLRRVVVYVQH